MTGREMIQTRIYCVGGVVGMAFFHLSFIMHIIMRKVLTLSLFICNMQRYFLCNGKNLTAYITHFGYFTFGPMNNVLDKISPWSLCLFFFYLKDLKFYTLILRIIGILNFEGVETNKRQTSFLGRIHVYSISCSIIFLSHI